MQTILRDALTRHEIGVVLRKPLADEGKHIPSQGACFGGQRLCDFADAHVVSRVALLLNCFDVQERIRLQANRIAQRLDGVVVMTAIGLWDAISGRTERSSGRR